MVIKVKNIILASASPRRKELLELAGLSFSVQTADVDEKITKGVLPPEAVAQLAKQKAKAVAKNNKSSLVIGADTVVCIDNEILGKPASREEAYSMLRRLSGREHFVYTGVCLVCEEKTISFSEKTSVTFYELSDEEINSYINSGDCYDKAGAYGIQSKGCVLVEKINGDYFNVVGLPIAKTIREIKKLK